MPIKQLVINKNFNKIGGNNRVLGDVGKLMGANNLTIWCFNQALILNLTYGLPGVIKYTVDKACDERSD